MRTKRVVVIDDHEVLRAGVCSFVASFPGYEVVGEAADARAGLRMVEAERPDVALMDLDLPGMDGIVATREICLLSPRTRVVVLSAHHQIHEVVGAFDAGAVGFVLKADPPETLMEALERVSRGVSYLAPTIAGCVPVLRKRRCAAGDVLSALSEREREVFRLAANGRTAVEIADDICIDRKTVHAHLNRINRKLGLRDRLQLTRLAISMGAASARN
jgi:NarL family two-component system response regulator LiaR